MQTFFKLYWHLQDSVSFDLLSTDTHTYTHAETRRHTHAHTHIHPPSLSFSLAQTNTEGTHSETNSSNIECQHIISSEENPIVNHSRHACTFTLLRQANRWEMHTHINGVVVAYGENHAAGLVHPHGAKVHLPLRFLRSVVYHLPITTLHYTCETFNKSRHM